MKRATTPCLLPGLHETLRALAETLNGLHKKLNNLHETIHMIPFKSTYFTRNAFENGFPIGYPPFSRYIKYIGGGLPLEHLTIIAANVPEHDNQEWICFSCWDLIHFPDIHLKIQ